MNCPRFLTPEKVRECVSKFGNPVYVYDENTLRSQAQKVLSFPAPFGLTARYAMKACSNSYVLHLFDSLGLHIDASSGFEVVRALKAGIAPGKIQLTAQEWALDFEDLKKKGILFVACSLHQLELYGKLFPGSSLGVRINPGLGSGHSNKTNVGGPGSSFGIWHEYISEIFNITKKYDLKINKLHTHIGSGADPEVWKKVAGISLEIAKQFRDVEVINLGGGFKVGRMPYEKTTDLIRCGENIASGLENFYKETGTKLHLEIEPGTFLAALSSSLIALIQDKVDTGKEGYVFLKLNSGMTEITRPALYGAQHPLFVIPSDSSRDSDTKKETVMVVGHCCESGDILTPEDGNSEALAPRELSFASIGDYMVIDGAGAYCSSMSTKNYNSFPEVAEVVLKRNGELSLIRKRQTLEQIIQNEVS